MADRMLFHAQAGRLEAVRAFMTLQWHTERSRTSGNTLLHIAATSGNADLVRYLVEECNGDIFLTNRAGRTPFLMACRSGGVEVAKFLLRHEAKLREGETEAAASDQTQVDPPPDASAAFVSSVMARGRDKKGNSGLLLAAQKRRWPMVRFLVTATGADAATDKNNAWETVLLLSAGRYAPFELLQWLVEDQKVDPTQQNSQGDTPLLRVAGCHKQLEHLRYLIDAGNSVKHANAKGDTALLVAAKSSQPLDLLRYLVECGSDPTHFNQDGDSVLTLCAGYRRDFEIVQYFAGLPGVDVSHSNERGETALNCTVRQRAGPNMQNTIRFLLNAGASVDHADTQGNTALMQVVCCNNNLDIIKLLLEAGANVAHENNNNDTPLLRAARFGDGHLFVIRFLVEEAGANPEHANLSGQTCLMLAAKYGQLKLLNYLVNQVGVQVDRVDSAGNTALMHAAASYSVRLDAIRFLVEEAGADVNIANAAGHTVLMLAVNADFHSNLAVVQYLVGAGADVNHTDSDGNTCVHVALDRYESLPVIQFLIETADADISIQNLAGLTCFTLPRTWRNTEAHRWLQENRERLEEHSRLANEAPLLKSAAKLV